MASVGNSTSNADSESDQPSHILHDQLVLQLRDHDLLSHFLLQHMHAQRFTKSSCCCAHSINLCSLLTAGTPNAVRVTSFPVGTCTRGTCVGMCYVRTISFFDSATTTTSRFFFERVPHQCRTVALSMDGTSQSWSRTRSCNIVFSLCSRTL